MKSDGWNIYVARGTTNVLPVNDVRPHTCSMQCNCSPYFLDGFMMIVHNAYDGREKAEPDHTPRPQ